MVNLQSTPVHVENYVRILELVCQKSQQMGLYDSNFKLLWTTDEFQWNSGLSQNTPEIKPGLDTALLELETEGEGFYYLKAFSVYSTGSVAFIILQSNTRLSETEKQEQSEKLDLAQTCIAESDHSQVCLTEKSREMQEVHYQYQPCVYDYNSGDEETASKQLLKDCVKSLGLVAAFSYSAESKQLISEVTDESLLDDTGLAISCRSTFIQRDIFRLCETSSAAFLYNQSAKNNGHSEDISSVRLLVAPLIDSNKECKGALICVRLVNNPAFTKSELRLTELMAEKAHRVFQTRYDSVTGFLNPEAYKKVIEKELIQQNSVSEKTSFLVLKLGNLDTVYATGGIAAGEHILSQVAALLTKRIRSRDCSGRLDKDEFSLILHNCNFDNAQVMAEYLLESISQFTFEWGGMAIRLDAWIGLVELSASMVSADNMIRAGREALQIAKESGNYKQALFTGMKNRHKELNRLGWEHRIYKTIINKDFKLFCQPIEDAGTYSDGIQRYEILLRLKNKDDVLLVPNVFINAASKLGLMGFVDRWVVSEVFKLSRSLNTHSSVPLFNFTINISADSISSEFANYIVNQAENLGILAESICFDLTEDAAMKNLKQTNRFIALLRKRGFEVALDDFGVGIGAYSSLRNLSLDYVKLNGNLVKNMVNDAVNAAIIESIATVCKTLGIKTIAESVENEFIKERLRKTNVDYIQGFQTARPRAVTEEFSKHLEGSASNTA